MSLLRLDKTKGVMTDYCYLSWVAQLPPDVSTLKSTDNWFSKLSLLREPEVQRSGNPSENMFLSTFFLLRTSLHLCGNISSAPHSSCGALISTVALSQIWHCCFEVTGSDFFLLFFFYNKFQTDGKDIKKRQKQSITHKPNAHLNHFRYFTNTAFICQWCEVSVLAHFFLHNFLVVLSEQIAPCIFPYFSEWTHCMHVCSQNTEYLEQKVVIWNTLTSQFKRWIMCQSTH